MKTYNFYSINGRNYDERVELGDDNDAREYAELLLRGDDNCDGVKFYEVWSDDAPASDDWEFVYRDELDA